MTSHPIAKRPLIGLVPLQAALIVHLAWYLLQPDKAISGALIALAGFTVVFALITSGIALFVTNNQLERIRAHFGKYADALIGMTAALLFGFGLLMRPEWIYAHLALTIAITAAAFARTLNPEHWTQTIRLARPLRLALVITGIAVIALRVYGLSYSPDLQITDEGWHLGWVMGLLREGRFTDYLMYFGGHDVQRYYFPMAIWIAVTGAGLWQARLFSYIVTLLVAFVGGKAANSLYGRTAGWIVGVLLFASANVMIGARIRHDAGLALAIAFSLWFYGIGLKREQQRWHFAAGLAIGLGWFAHYHATIFGAAMLIGLYVPRLLTSPPVSLSESERGRTSHPAIPPSPNRRGGRGVRFTLTYALGGAVGAVIVVMLQIYPHTQQGDSIERTIRGAPDLVGILASTWGHILSIAQHSQIEFIVILFAVGVALFRRRLLDFSLALVVILSHLALGFTEESAWSHYPMPLTPLYMLLVAVMISPPPLAPSLRSGEGERSAWKSPPLYAMERGSGSEVARNALTWTAFIALPVLALTLQTPLVKLLDRAPVQMPTPPAAQWVLDNIEPNTVIEGEHFYYLWLMDYRYVSPLTPNFLSDSQKTALPTRESVWDEIVPELYIFDPNLSTCCVLNWMLETDYFELRGYEIAAQFEGSRYPITIYRRTNPSP